LGVQKTIQLDASNYYWYYGVRSFAVSILMKESGKGSVTTNSSGFEQINRLSLKDEIKVKSIRNGHTTVGLTYRFSKHFFVSIESKFVMAYVQTKELHIKETRTNQSGEEFCKYQSNSKKENGFDLGIKPLSLVCLGILF